MWQFGRGLLADVLASWKNLRNQSCRSSSFSLPQEQERSGGGHLGAGRVGGREEEVGQPRAAPPSDPGVPPMLTQSALLHPPPCFRASGTTHPITTFSLFICSFIHSVRDVSAVTSQHHSEAGVQQTT